MEKRGKGQNVENQNIESQKVDRKFEKDQYVKSFFFLIDQSIENEVFDQNI
jgi:hypothetical protein